MSQHRPPAQTKIYDPTRLATQIQDWKKQGQKVVFTNGCFDILHAGHIRYLESAATLGDKLVIAVNDDASVQRLKGETRPINVLASRLYLLASLQCVDAVVPFSEDTPLDIIKLLHPDVLVKGGDYKPENIVGAKEVVADGGKVVVVPFVEGYSTTKLELKILALHKNKPKDT